MACLAPALNARFCSDSDDVYSALMLLAAVRNMPYSCRSISSRPLASAMRFLGMARRAFRDGASDCKAEFYLPEQQLGLARAPGSGARWRVRSRVPSSRSARRALATAVVQVLNPRRAGRRGEVKSVASGPRREREGTVQSDQTETRRIVTECAVRVRNAHESPAETFFPAGLVGVDCDAWDGAHKR